MIIKYPVSVRISSVILQGLFLSVFIVAWIWTQPRFLHRGWLTGRSHIYRFSPPSLFFPHNLPLMRMSRLFCWACHSLDFTHRTPEVSPVYASIPCMPVVVRSGDSAGFRSIVFLLVSFIGGMWTSVRGFPRLVCVPVWLTFTGFRCGS